MDIEQRNYFSFYDYEYYLDVSKQYLLMPSVTPLLEGLQKSFDWYKYNTEKVIRKPFLDYIKKHNNCWMIMAVNSTKFTVVFEVQNINK